MRVQTTKLTFRLAPNEVISGSELHHREEQGTSLLVFTSNGRLLSASPNEPEARELRLLTQWPSRGRLAHETHDRVVMRSMGPYLSLAAPYGVRATVLSLDDPTFRVDLVRGDYQVRVCEYPLAFVQRAGRAHLIHAVDWNRLELTDLESGRSLWSATNEGREAFDYFMGRLTVSPRGDLLVSQGWVWSPYEATTCWSIDSFDRSFEPGGRHLEGPTTSGYHWERALTFVDDARIAWVYNRRESGEEQLPRDHPSELILQNTLTGEIEDRFPIEALGADASNEGEAFGELAFDPEGQCFIAFGGPGHETVVMDRRGKTIDRIPMDLHGYCPKARMGWTIEEGGVITLVEISD